MSSKSSPEVEALRDWSRATLILARHFGADKLPELHEILDEMFKPEVRREIRLLMPDG